MLIHTGYGHSEADVVHQSLLEANIATEVCLTALDTLSLFTLAFKVCIKHSLFKVRGFWSDKSTQLVKLNQRQCMAYVFTSAGLASIKRLLISGFPHDASILVSYQGTL